jgi:hypothetical protein
MTRSDRARTAATSREQIHHRPLAQRVDAVDTPSLIHDLWLEAARLRDGDARQAPGYAGSFDEALPFAGDPVSDPAANVELELRYRLAAIVIVFRALAALLVADADAEAVRQLPMLLPLLDPANPRPVHRGRLVNALWVAEQYLS